MLDIRPVPKSSRIGEERAATIIYLLGGALGKKFPKLPEPIPTLSTIREFVGRRDYDNVVARLRSGEVPLRLYPVLPVDVREALALEDTEALRAMTDAAEEPSRMALSPHAKHVKTAAAHHGNPHPTEGFQYCPYCHSGEALATGGTCSNCNEYVEPHESTFPKL